VADPDHDDRQDLVLQCVDDAPVADVTRSPGFRIARVQDHQIDGGELTRDRVAETGIGGLRRPT
jgi:hypothetical protein